VEGTGGFISATGSFNHVKRDITAGYGMAAFGFALLLLNALAFITRSQIRSPAASILGIVLLGTGLALVRKSRRE
jgi:hypothetical protein